MTKCKNFVAEFEQMVKNCPNSTLKANLEVSLAGGHIEPEACVE
jgi:hypothetical protein